MYIVTAPLVVVAVSDSRREVYLARGRTVPDTITDASLAHLLGRGLIASKEQPETETPDAPDTPDVPEQPVEPAKPVGEMTVDELKAYAAEHGIDLTGASKKDDILAAIQAARVE